MTLSFDPQLTYSSGTRVPKEHVILVDKLMAFERKIMRKIYGATRTDDGYGGVETNQEINDILKGQHMIGFTKKQR
jgi:hypothetical protein